MMSFSNSIVAAPVKEGIKPFHTTVAQCSPLMQDIMTSKYPVATCDSIFPFVIFLLFEATFSVVEEEVEEDEEEEDEDEEAEAEEEEA